MTSVLVFSSVEPGVSRNKDIQVRKRGNNSAQPFLEYLPEHVKCQVEAYNLLTSYMFHNNHLPCNHLNASITVCAVLISLNLEVTDHAFCVIVQCKVCNIYSVLCIKTGLFV